MRITPLNQFSLQEHTHHSVSYLAQNQRTTFTIQVLEEDIVRVLMLPDGAYRLQRTWAILDRNTSDVPIQGRDRADLSPFTCPPSTIQVNDAGCELTTPQLTARFNAHSGQVQWLTGDGQLFARDARRNPYNLDPSSRRVYHYMAWDEHEHYYGFGEKAGDLDKSEYRMEMRNTDALGYSARQGDPLYKHWAFYITWLPERQIAYGLFYDNLSTSVFDMGRERHAYYDAYRMYMAEDGDLDYYLIYGASMAQVLEKFTRLTGRMPVPPRWSLGYLGSTMAYTDMEDAQAQLLGFVEKCQTHRIRCSGFHLSSGYTTDPDTHKRYVFNWNPKRIPDIKGMVDAFHSAGIKLLANVKPYILQTHPHYANLKEHGALVLQAEADQPASMSLWSGSATDREDGAHLDFTHPHAYTWWKQQATEQLLEYGIDTLWNDNNEYGLWDDFARCMGHGEPINLGQIRPLLTMLMVRASYEAQVAHQAHMRPFVLTRSATVGMQRYAQTWSGDNRTSWESLRYNIPMGLGMGLSGMPNVGHDVGGFYGEAPTPELLVRWVQNGIFHPRFTIHSWNSGEVGATEPWMYPEVLPLIREAIDLRYQLIPYLYALIWEASERGCPIIRPMVYEFPTDPNCTTESFDFMLGSHLLIPSVVEEGAVTRSIYLPSGNQWYDPAQNQWFDGGQTITLDTPLERIPMLYRENAIIAYAPTDETRLIRFYPAPHSATHSFTCIEDDGETLAYAQGTLTRLTFELQTTPDHIQITLHKVGEYELPYRSMELEIIAGEDRPIVLEGDFSHEERVESDTVKHRIRISW